MAIIDERMTGAGKRWVVRWKEWSETEQRWKDKGRSCRDKETAKQLKRDVENEAALGRNWTEQRETVVCTLGEIRDHYNAAAVGRPAATVKWRKALMTAWIGFAGETTLASELSTKLLREYAATLPATGRGAATRHRKVLEVERMWRWARKDPDTFPGVPEPAQITGDDAGAVQAPPPVVRTASPTWDDVDAMIGQLRAGWKYGDVHRRIAVFLRYTGVRISQALTLRWDDLDLGHETPFVRIRAGRVGAKSSRGRVIPLHPALVRELAGWGRREGLVFDPGPRVGATWEDGEACRTAFTTAWKKAGIDIRKWSVGEAELEAGERAHGSPTHAIRAAVKTGLLRAGVAESLADYYIGHSKGATTAAYVPEDAPETSPLWEALVEAVGTIPEHRPPNVLPLQAKG